MNLATLVTTDRRAYEIICGMIHAVILDAAVHLGEQPGLGDCPAGKARVYYKVADTSSTYPFGRVVNEEDMPSLRMQGYEYLTPLPWTPPPNLPGEFHAATPPEATPLQIQPAIAGLGRAKIIAVNHAVKIAENVAGDFVKQAHRQTTAYIRTGKNAYRRLEAFNRIKYTTADRLLVAKIKILRAAYPGKRGKKGVQRISTRRVKGIPVRGWFQFNGRPAYHGPRGRRPLTEAEWIRRYEARRAKRCETTPRPKRRKPVKVPPVIGGRPKRALVSPGAHDTVQPRNIYLGNSSPQLEPTDYFAPFELDPVLIAADWPEIDPNTGQV
jgi:hypothetical protein